MAGEYINISRDTWTTVMNGLASDDREVRTSAYTRLLAAAPPGWCENIADPDVQSESRPHSPPRGEGRRM